MTCGEKKCVIWKNIRFIPLYLYKSDVKCTYGIDVLWNGLLIELGGDALQYQGANIGLNNWYGVNGTHMDAKFYYSALYIFKKKIKFLYCNIGSVTFKYLHGILSVRVISVWILNNSVGNTVRRFDILNCFWRVY